MFKEVIHHVGVHIAQHPKETAATVLAAGKAAAPVLVATAPYVLGAAAVVGIIYGVGKLAGN